MRKLLHVAASLLLLTLSACFHFHHKNLPNQATAPPLETTQVDSASTVTTPPAAPVQTPPITTAATPPADQSPAPTTNPDTQPEETPPRHPVHHKKPETQDSKPPEVANAAPEVPAVGKLSPGDPSDLRLQTDSSLNSIDQTLKKFNRPLNDQEQKTVAQIREFLKQARAALATGDVDGAHTLALKAKVLLDEITH